MKNYKKDDKLLVQFILKYCNQVEETIKRLELDLDRLENDFLSQNALSMPILQIGELIGSLSKDFFKKYNGLPWKEIIGIRHRMAHWYDVTDFEIIWIAATERIPEVKKYFEEILDELEKQK